MRRAVKKRDAKLFGPFKVKKLVGPEGQSVELELPSRWRVHNIFHTSLVEPYRSSGRGLRDEPIAVTDSRYVDRLGVTHEVGYDFVSFESCICTPLHRARRAMAAAKPLPLAG